jgi:hypothetical protein
MSLPFIGADELRASTPAEPDWTWAGYLAPGAVTILAGKPKAGKSTLALAVAEAVATGAAAFLGRSIKGGPVVYISEESAATLAHKLPATAEIRVLSRDAAWPKPSWPALIGAACEEALRVSAVLLVIDTWPFFAGLAKDAEKDAGAAGQAMQHALDATHDGLAVMLAGHTRKAGGEDGDALRGSSAIAGAADIVLELERTEQPSERALLALSRFPSTPGSVIFDYDKVSRSWSVEGEGERSEARSMRLRQAILSALRDGGELTNAGLEKATGVARREWHTELNKLVDDGQVRRSGEGKRGDPYRFEILRKDSAERGAQDAQKDAAEDSAEAPAQKPAETPGEGVVDSGAHPVGMQNHHNAALPANGASRAESNGELGDGWTDAALQELIDSEAYALIEREETEG